MLMSSAIWFNNLTQEQIEGSVGALLKYMSRYPSGAKTVPQRSSKYVWVLDLGPLSKTEDESVINKEQVRNRGSRTSPIDTFRHVDVQPESTILLRPSSQLSCLALSIILLRLSMGSMKRKGGRGSLALFLSW
ncbi:hypothetical protein HAX54_046875 [Datura stramonium]|uniref:Uncharacterized protein n=1 Tax=Datura stramonium TaxID=4076 RepID=A0ABS8SSC3_DATST|nr:hypothetical protein [Datura stramonium]